jgi:ABC-type transport system substrate-binding protein
MGLRPSAGQGADVQAGRLDVAYPERLTLRRLPELRSRFGTRLQSGPLPATQYAVLNVSAPPFDDVRVRRALNFAVDRARMVDLAGGPDAASPTCQELPPGLPGYRTFCPFTAAPSRAGVCKAPDPTRAHRLVAASGTRGTTVNVWTPDGGEKVARELIRTLRELGLRGRLWRFEDHGGNCEDVKARHPPHILFTGWAADTAEPAMFLRQIVSCHPAMFAPGKGFCDRRLDAAIDRAQAAGPGDAARQRIERRIAEDAPIVPLRNFRWTRVTSPRASNLVCSPFRGKMFDQMWVR